MKNRIIKFAVCNQHISTDDICVVADSRNYLLALFEFDSTWEGVIKTAVFSNGENVYNMLLDDDMCRIPAEVVCGDGFFVSVFGGDLITADRVKISVTPSGMVEGVAPPEPTPSVYDQMLTLVATEAAAAEGSADAAEQSAVSAAQSAKAASADKQALISGGTLWVFDGGNADGQVFISQVADGELSDTSVNAVQNSVIKAAVDSTREEALAAAQTAKEEALAEADAAFEGNFKEIAADYIVEQGYDATTEMYYRKWNNGTAECWGTLKWSGTITTATTSGRYMSARFSKDFPAQLFATTPSIQASPQYGNVSFEIMRWQYSWAGIGKTGDYFIVTESQLSSAPSDSFRISIYAIGTWK